MLTQEDDVDAHALRRQGWTISAIARHLGHDRSTIRAYLDGGRIAGRVASTLADPLGPFVGYVATATSTPPSTTTPAWHTARSCPTRPRDILQTANPGPGRLVSCQI
jgi:hypothetical protein